jgi:hypothetical protein
MAAMKEDPIFLLSIASKITNNKALLDECVKMSLSLSVSDLGEIYLGPHLNEVDEIYRLRIVSE